MPAILCGSFKNHFKRKLMRQFILFAALSLGSFSYAFPQKNIAEKMGYAKDAKLLIIHADDAGVAHAVDSATITAFAKHAITSVSIMVPCPWFPEIAAYAKAHPEMDWGIHLTLTSEWKNYRWGGISSSDKISSLLDENGFFYPSVEAFAKNAKLPEVETELRAQIEKARSFGIKITHLDSHMGSIFASGELFKIYQKIGKEYGLPILQLSSMTAFGLEENSAVIDGLFIASKAVPVNEWGKMYDEMIQQVKPGLNELIIHLGFDGDELRAVTTEHPDFGAAWRQNDFNYAMNESLKALLKKENIQLISWGDIQKVMQSQVRKTSK
jgi:predicted glycoside hydrolase/deacetylase ChbG (UPF0249 family)